MEKARDQPEEQARDARSGPTGPKQDTRGFVKQFVEAVHARKMPLAILVDLAASIDFDGDRILILFEDTNAFARKSVEQPANVAILKEVADGILRRPVAFVIARAADLEDIGPPPADGEPADDAGFESAGDADTAEPIIAIGAAEQRRVTGSAEQSIVTGDEDHAHTAAAEAKRRRLLVEAAEDPVIKNILERFEGRIVEVKEVS